MPQQPANAHKSAREISGWFWAWVHVCVMAMAETVDVRCGCILKESFACAQTHSGSGKTVADVLHRKHEVVEDAQPLNTKPETLKPKPKPKP